MTKVNVVITCYNKQGTIARTIETVKSQTLKDFKCIVVDDGSTDNSWDIIKNSTKDDGRFVVIKLENSGVANARNTGISHGDAQYIVCLDGDDGLESEFLETCYNAIKDMKCIGIVYTDALLAHAGGRFTVAGWSETDPKEQFNGKNQVPCCNMFRRDIFERVGGYRQRYAPNGAGAEDAELWLRFFKLGYTAKKISQKPLFIYNMYNGFTTSENYTEVNWINWHTHKPFPSLEIPDNNINHVVREYESPEVSVIIPVCETHIHFLVDALDSLEAQTFYNWEAIVVFDINDSALDGLDNDYYEKAYPYVKFVYTSGGLGAGAARNIGVEASRGDYLVFLDADDYLQPRYIELTLSALKHFKADWMYTDVYGQTIHYKKEFEDHKRVLGDNFVSIVKEKNGKIEYLWIEECEEWNVEKLYYGGIAAVTSLYKRSDFDLVGGFDEENNREDWDFHMRLASAGKCGLRLPLPLFTYRLNAGIRREYKDVAKTQEESSKLKRQDIQRIQTKYDKKELEMGCTACRKNKINIKPARESDLNTLQYIGKIPGGIVKGKVTGNSYSIVNSGNIKVIQKVHPQDAAKFVELGIFKALPKQKKSKNIIVSATPIKVVEIESKEYAEKRQVVKIENTNNLKKKKIIIDTSAKIAPKLMMVTQHPDKLLDFSEQGISVNLDSPEDQFIDFSEELNKNIKPWPELVNNPEKGSIKDIKKLLSESELDQDALEHMLYAEQNSVNRKGAVKVIRKAIKAI